MNDIIHYCKDCKYSKPSLGEMLLFEFSDTKCKHPETKTRNYVTGKDDRRFCTTINTWGQCSYFEWKGITKWGTFKMVFLGRSKL